MAVTTAPEAPGTAPEPAPARANGKQGFRPTPLGWVARGLIWAAIAWVVFVFPLSRENFEVQRYSQAVIYGIIGLSLNVLLGYVGQISLGHQAFVGIGAFASAYMVSVQQQPFAVAIGVALLLGALQALVLGGVSLRIRGLYFALVTLSYGLMAEQSLFQIKSLTGGGQGQPAPLPGGFNTPHRYYYLCLMFLAAVLWVDYRMMKSKGGRALLALRENPRVAATFGINVKAFTLFAFVVAGTFAGLGGALFAHNSGIVVSTNVFDFRLALIFVIMTGAAFFALLGYFIDHLSALQTVLRNIPFTPDLTKEIAPLVVGPLLLLLTLAFFPGGIGQQIRPVQSWLRGNRFNIHDRGEKDVQVADVRA
jgi:branched-chain amino acid transport system permease protein